MGANFRTYRLAKSASEGVACDAGGLFVGGTALLTRTEALEDDGGWRPRPLADLNEALTRRYRAPVDMSDKLGGLAASTPDAPFHAAVIGSDGSISCARGGVRPEDYETRNVIRVAPPGTIPMRNPDDR